MSAEEHDDDGLLRRARGGDESAFVALYRRWHGAIYRFALRMSGSPALAEDVVQEVFMALIHRTEGFDPSRGPLSSYLYGVARNQLRRGLERQRPFIPLDENADARDRSAPPSAENPLGELEKKERTHQVWRAVLALPRLHREVVVLCDLQELTYDEAAVALGCPVGTVRSRLHRGRGRLADMLRSQCSPEASPPGPVNAAKR